MLNITSLQWKLGAGVLIGVVAVSVIALSYRHYTGLVDSKAELSAQVATLREDVAREKARADSFERAIDRWDQAAKDQAKALDDFTIAQREAGTYARELLDVLSKHDLGALAKRKPGLIENRINAGSADALRLLERATQGPAVDGGQGAAAAGAAASGARAR